MNGASKHIKIKHILFCRCGRERIAADLLQSVDEHIRQLPVVVTVMSDLCSLVPLKRDLLQDLINADAEFLVIGCYSRTMKLLFDQAKENESVPFVYQHMNLIELTADEAIERLDAFCMNQKGTAVYNEIREET